MRDTSQEAPTTGRQTDQGAPSSRPTVDSLLTPAEAAERLGLTKRFIYRLTTQHRIRFVRVGKFVRIRESDLEAFIAAGVVDPTAPLRGHESPSGSGRRRRQKPPRDLPGATTEPAQRWTLGRDGDEVT